MYCLIRIYKYTNHFVLVLGKKNMGKKAQFQVKASYVLKVLLWCLFDSPANLALSTQIHSHWYEQM